MSPGSNTESYPAFAHIGLRENPGKNLNQVTCPDRESNPGHLVSQPDVLTITPQVFLQSQQEWQCYITNRLLKQAEQKLQCLEAHQKNLTNALITEALVIEWNGSRQQAVSTTKKRSVRPRTATGDANAATVLAKLVISHHGQPGKWRKNVAPVKRPLTVRELLNEVILGHWIGRRPPVEWLPKSPDLTPLDFFLWGHLKSVVYSNRPRKLDELQENIRRECA
ncbi:hypothetical protein ANN_01476 [Periplaneta americana]|uniref:Uncharacterized protein n=1 Tax=Periplaneta americana TaxID=6978 RepID=A0ABQ8TTP6_PERAM|nr:hypothetical protein ANN_01476 [Periplaneta americana]